MQIYQLLGLFGGVKGLKKRVFDDICSMQHRCL